MRVRSAIGELLRRPQTTVCLELTLLLAAPVPLAGQRACGVERWRVKILADADRDRVNMAPRPANIADLLSIPAPGFLPARNRIPPHELQVYRVRAVIRETRGESDGDWHLIIAEPGNARVSMIAEIPDSACALGSGHEGEYAAAGRAARRTRRTQSGG